MPYDKKEKRGISWDEYYKNADDENFIITAKYYTVFNAKNIEGIPELATPEIKDISEDYIIAKLSANMEVEILNDGGNKAYYEVNEDKIHMPEAKYFVDDYAYNSTVLHELAHSTGNSSRLNRDIMNMFGSNDYAYEELIAEISSCFMSANLSLKADEAHINNHKAYVQSWIQAIEKKPDTLIKAIREAEKVSNYMEFKAELVNEKDYKLSLGNSMEVEIRAEDREEEKGSVSNNQIAEPYKKKSLQDIKNAIAENKSEIAQKLDSKEIRFDR